MSEYKQCPNGHYYQGDHCPYCKNAGSVNGRTEIYGETMKTSVGYVDPTVAMPSNNGGGKTELTGSGYNNIGTPGQKTTVVEGTTGTVVPPAATGSSPVGSRTMFGDEETLMPGAPAAAPGAPAAGMREARKLVGWLVSYTLDPMGVDFKLYEGRNIIGRDMDCNITVVDKMVSSKHAVLLYRAGKFSITDSQSSHGTFVNNEDIELEPRYLQDGDVITIGQTVFKFRTAI